VTLRVTEKHAEVEPARIAHSGNVKRVLSAQSEQGSHQDPRCVPQLILVPSSSFDAERFEEKFARRPGWTGIAGTAPKDKELSSELGKHDAFIYCGHTSSEQYFKVILVRSSPVYSHMAHRVTSLTRLSAAQLRF
jgi:hypothetical protein